MALPAWPTPLIGRVQERQAVADRIGESRVVTLTGAGGSGKTRLAHAVAEDLQRHFRSGVAWVDLARLTAPEQAVGAAVAACGARETPGVAALDLLVRHLASAELLLVLDNCEHLLSFCTELAEALLRACPQVRVLATSREPLGVAGEVTWRVPSLGLCEPGERDPVAVAASDAASLFVARARAARSDFVLDAESAPLVARVCRRLDGIPLALELAAARMRALSLQRLADGLDDRFRLLTGGARSAVARQRTLLASVEWSHDLLDEEERTLFRRLAVFGAPFSLEAAEAVAADDDLDATSVFDLLARLVDKSLVVHAGDRYRLLETIRQYALERADDAGELAELRERQLTWLERRARGWRLDCEIGRSAVLAEVGVEAPDLIAAAEWSAAQGRAPVAILHALSETWAGRDAYAEAALVSRRILGALSAGSREWLEAAAPVAMILVPGGDYALLGEMREALERWGAELDPVARATVEAAVALPLAFVGRSEAYAALRQASEVGRRCGNRKLEVHTKGLLANVMSQNGDVAAARALMPWLGRNLARDSRSYVIYESCQVLLAVLDGDLTLGRRLVEQALAREERVGLLALAALIGMLSMDAELLEQVAARSKRFELVGIYAGLPLLAEVQRLVAQGDFEAAQRALDAATVRGELAPGFRAGSVLERELVGMESMLALTQGDLDRAQALLAKLEPILEGSELHFARGMHGLQTALLARARGENAVAEERAHTVLAAGRQMGHALLQANALELLAILAGEAGDSETAARLLGATDAFRSRSLFRVRGPDQARALDELRPKLPLQALAEGATLSLKEAGEYASRGRGQRGRPEHGWASLTPSEQRVVELVAEGLPNAAIARKLFVSLATVKTHLVHVYGKLDLRTRAELAAAATARRLSQDAAARRA